MNIKDVSYQPIIVKTNGKNLEKIIKDVENEQDNLEVENPEDLKELQKLEKLDELDKKNK